MCRGHSAAGHNYDAVDLCQCRGLTMLINGDVLGCDCHHCPKVAPKITLITLWFVALHVM
jgi:hypothetical protein